MNAVLTLAGWIGAVLSLLAYGLLILERLSGSGLWFNAMNMIGSVFLVGSAIAAGAFPNVLINLVWLATGFYAVVTHGRRRRRNLAEATVERCPTDGDQNTAMRNW